MKKEQSNCWVNPVWWSPKGQDTLNLSWRSGLSRSRRDRCGAVFQKDKRANLGSSLVQWRVGYHGAVVHIPQETKLNLHIDLSAYNDLMLYSRREKLVGNHLLGKKWVMECKQGQRQCSPTKTEKETWKVGQAKRTQEEATMVQSTYQGGKNTTCTWSCPA